MLQEINKKRQKMLHETNLSKVFVECNENWNKLEDPAVVA